MPAYSFQKQFVPKVESGEKTHTIRGKRKARPKAGQRFVGYFGMRTKRCRKLIDSTITRVQDIRILEAVAGEEFFIVEIDGERLSTDECEQLAVRDGFANFEEMVAFWEGRMPFFGDIIHWHFPEVAK